MHFLSAWLCVALLAMTAAEAVCPSNPVTYAPTDVRKTFIRSGTGEFNAARAAGGSHKGVDIVLNANYPEDTPYSVHAIDGGTVAYAQINGSENTGYGNLVVIDHGSNCYSLYAHLASKPFSTVKPGANLLVKIGDKVKIGQLIGYFVSVAFDIDSTGNARKVGKAARYQMHFELISTPSGRAGPGRLGDTILKAPATRIDPTPFLRGAGYTNQKVD